MMYQVLSVPVVLAAFAGGYYANVPPSVFPHTPDLAERARASSQAAMAGEADEVNDGNEALIVEPEATGSHHISRARDGLFYVRAVVNGRPVRFLVDTGSTVVVLSDADARAVGVAPRSGRYNARMVTAGGNRPMAWTTLGHVKVAGKDVHGVTAAVISGGPSVSLLGQNLLSKLGGMRLDGDRMEFEASDSVD